MTVIVLLVIVVVQWVVIATIYRALRKKPVTISMKEVSEQAAELSRTTGITYGEALRSLMGMLNYGARFTK